MSRKKQNRKPSGRNANTTLIMIILASTLGLLVLAGSFLSVLFLLTGNRNRLEALVSAQNISDVASGAPDEDGQSASGETWITPTAPDSEYNHADSLVLWAENTLLANDSETVLELHIRLTDDQPLSDLTILNDAGETVAQIAAANLIPVESGTDATSGFREYRFSAAIPASENGTINAVDLTAQMGSQKSSTLTCYRDVPVTDEMLNRCCEILDGLTEFTESLGEEVTLEDGTSGRKISEEELLAQVMDYLHSQEPVAWADFEGERTIRFETTDGLSSFYTLTEVYEDDFRNYCGSGVTTDPGVIQETHFLYDKTFRTAPVNTNVLLMCPIRASYSDRDGDKAETVGRALAQTLGGSFRLVTDVQNDDQVINVLRSGALSNYGTVMLITHGSAWSRGNGTKYILFTMYSSRSQERARDVWDNWIATYKGTDSLGYANCLMNVTKQNAPGKSGVRIAFGVNQKYFMKTNMVIRTHYDIDFSSTYLMDIYSGDWFPNTMFYLGACESFADETFLSFLCNHGACCVAGYQLPVSIVVEPSICEALFEHAMEENEAAATETGERNFTIQEAKRKGYGLWMTSLAAFSNTEEEPTSDSTALTWNYTFVYEGEGKVSGRVTDEEEKPVDEASVIAWRYLNGRLEETMRTTTQNGDYAFEHLPYGMYLFQAYKDAVEDFEPVSFSEAETTGVDLCLKQELEALANKIDGGVEYSMAITEDGTLYSWGANSNGRMGRDTSGNSYLSPGKVMDHVISVSAGGWHSLILTEDGSLYACGRNVEGQVGNRTSSKEQKAPEKILTDVIAASAGDSHSMAVTSDGTLYTWGYNMYGQLGNGSYGKNTGSSTPQKVTGIRDVVMVSAGFTHSMAVTKDGSLYVWGYEGFSPIDQTQVEPVKVMDHVTAIGAGAMFSMAVTSDGSLYTWGNNDYGELGDGTTTRSLTPKKVMDDVVTISVSGWDPADSSGTFDNHVLAVTSDGSLYTWGRNGLGQLGIGSEDHAAHATPQKIMDQVVWVGTGRDHSLAATTDGTLYAWGGNYCGQLGTGNKTDANRPQKIMEHISMDREVSLRNRSATQD